MILPIVQSSRPVLLVGGGDVGSGDINDVLGFVDHIIGVDGGADSILAAGLHPDAVIGDLDSLSAQARVALPSTVLHAVAEQDSTDFEKALMRVAAPLIIGVGFLGGRLDHQLAALHALMRFAHRPCVLLGSQDVVLLCPPTLRLTIAPGDVVSLFPLCRLTGRSSGLDWPIDGLMLEPGVQIGTSNAACLPDVTLSADRPGLIVILPRSRLGAILQAQFWLGAQWPAL